jgi:hypothetical protein
MVQPDVLLLVVEVAHDGAAGISITTSTASINNIRPVTPKHFFIFSTILSPYPWLFFD